MFRPFYTPTQEVETRQDNRVQNFSEKVMSTSIQSTCFEGPISCPQAAQSNQDFPECKTSKPQTESSRLSRQIFVGGLPTNVTPPLFREWAEVAFPGRVVNAVLVVDRLTHTRSRGFGFITFDSNEMVEIASRMRLLQFSGKVVEIKKAENVSISQRKKNSGHDYAAPPELFQTASPEVTLPQRRISSKKSTLGYGKSDSTQRYRSTQPSSSFSLEQGLSTRPDSGDVRKAFAKAYKPDALVSNVMPQQHLAWEEDREPSFHPASGWNTLDCRTAAAFGGHKSHPWKNVHHNGTESTEKEWNLESYGIENVPDGSIGVAGILALQASIVNMAIEDEYDNENFAAFGKARVANNIFSEQLSGTCARS